MEIEAGGQIQGISLSSFLQMVQMDKTSCTLKICSNDDIGYLYLEEGALVAAETGSLKNVEAAYKILSWNNTLIVIDNAPAPDRNIKIPLMSILMEGLKRKDEKASRKNVPPGRMVPPEIEFNGKGHESLDNRIASEFIERAEAVEEKKAMELPAGGSEKPATESENETRAAATQTAEPTLPEKRENEAPVESGNREVKPAEVGVKILKCAFLAALSIVVVFTALYFFNASKLRKEYDSVRKQADANHRFADKKKIFEHYLNTHNDNHFTVHATSRINELARLIHIEKEIALLPPDDHFLKKAKTLYTSFLSKNPESAFAGDVQKEMARLPGCLDNLKFQKLVNLTGVARDRRMKEYREYLRSNPRGKYRQEVENLIAAMSDELYESLEREIIKCETRENWKKCIELAEKFLSDFETDSRKTKVIELKTMMMDRSALSDMKFRAGIMDFKDAKAMYLQYLKNNPDSTVAGEVRGAISAYNRKINLKAQWDKIAEYATNPSVTLLHRISKLQEYISGDNTGLFTRESKELLDKLQNEQKAATLARTRAEKKRLEMLRLKKIREEKARIRKEQEMARLAKLRREEKEAHLTKEAERINGLLGKKRGRFTENQGRTITDQNTNLTWCLLDSFIESDTCMTYEKALDYVEKLHTGGYTDWRLPTTSELAMLYNGSPFYPSSGAAWYWTSNTTTGAWGQNHKIGIFRPDIKDEFKKEFVSHEACGFVHAVRP